MTKQVDALRRALVVDDETDICRQLREAFEAARWEVRVAEDGLAAEKQVVAFDPSVVVLDLRMPKKGGLEVLDFIRSERPWSQVIILTGHGNEDDAIECVNKHAYCFLRKTVPPTEVVVVAEQALAEIPEPVRALQSWFNALPDRDKVIYTTASGERVSASRLFDEVRHGTAAGREFLENVMAVAVELITERL